MLNIAKIQSQINSDQVKEIFEKWFEYLKETDILVAKVEWQPKTSVTGFEDFKTSVELDVFEIINGKISINNYIYPLLKKHLHNMMEVFNGDTHYGILFSTVLENPSVSLLFENSDDAEYITAYLTKDEETPPNTLLWVVSRVAFLKK